ncbi:MAG: primosomal protein N' [Bacteroidales bacterium]|nr:primosomal protein N' [Bacteroidales bacterium]MCF8344885.1 primosomal protein N' [Bacteroidales bacterium]MCF8374719.1 primosomal protein N' [Bacteroidales bacterium]
MERQTLFAEVLLPLPVKGLYTYRVPFELNETVRNGQRVVVQFGKKKIYTGIVFNIHENPPKSYQVKYILSVLDLYPVVNEIQMEFWRWISEYYMSSMGEVMNTALPSSLKLASETKIALHPAYDGDISNLNEKELFVTEALHSQQRLTLTELSDVAGIQKVIPLIKTMLEKKVIVLEEELTDPYKPKKESFVYLTKTYRENEESLKDVFDELEKRAFKQLKILMTFLNLSQQNVDISRPELIKKSGATHSQLNALVEKGVFEIQEKEVSRLESGEAKASADDITFTEKQQIAYDEIKKGFQEKNTLLLHGVTSSGKTEIYIKLINEVIREGKQVLYLLPEIALTTQIINRLRRYFGEQVGVYHSRYSKNEKVEIWSKVNEGNENNSKFQIIIGPRSALFLPFSDLGLVIVDEEQDQSFKQFDPAPRYHARDSAIYLAGLHQAKTLLGSATPALESYYNAKEGKYHFVELTERFGGIKMPEIILADIRRETRHKTMKSHFSSLLMDHMKESLDNHKQLILFQNRRGFSLRLECNICGHIPQCKNCDVTLIYHKYSNHLRCHYCGWTTRIPELCPSCNNNSLFMKGFGTEKVEDDLAILLPDPVIKRMDLDTTRKKHAYQQIITDFEQRKIDILVGTQMVTKGLDFDNVELVGILNADNMLSYPDFRSQERSFQLMAQVSGRAGRKGKRGKVIIQTFNPQHPIILDVINHDYVSMYKSQIQERARYKYPPFYRLIMIRLKHKENRLLNEGASAFADILRASFGQRVLGPEYPIVSRIKNQYIKTVLIKLERTASLKMMKTTLHEKVEEFEKIRDFKGVRVILDVDPV